MDASVGSALQLLLGAVLLILLGALLFYSLYIMYLRNKYSHIPLPEPVNFFLGHLNAFRKSTEEHGNVEVLFCEWSQKYGNTFVVFLLSEVIVVTCNPDSVKELMVTGNFNKSRRYKVIGWTLGQRVLGRGLVTELDYANWNIRRLGMNPAFHRTVLKDLMTEFNSTGNDLIDVLGSHADKKDQVLLGSLMHKATLDVIGKVAFGKDLGSLKDEESPFATAIFDMMMILNKSIQNPLLALPFRAKEMKVRLKEVMAYLRQTSNRWLDERKEAVKRGDYIPDDILTHMMKLREENMDIMTDEIMLDDFVTFFVAGQETTANTTSFMLMEAGRNPEILRRLQEEVDEVIGQKAQVNFDDLTKLEYMSMVWKETLRMYPVVPASFRDIDRDGYKIDGLDIPRDSIVMTSSFISSRNPNFVNDPLTFKPERFAPDSKEKPNTYVYFPFALGPRNCLGQTFAQLEGKVIMIKILQNFNYELDPTQSFDILEAATLRPKGGVKAKISWRNTK